MKSPNISEVNTSIKKMDELENSIAVIVYDSEQEPINITHRNLIAAASALITEYNITDSDVVLIEPISVSQTLSLYMATMLCGASISFTNRIMDICGDVQPTILSASNASYFAIYKELFCLCRLHPTASFLLSPLRRLLQNTHYFRLVRQRRVTEILGNNLRLCLSFYSLRPLSKSGHILLGRMIGVPISIIFGTPETCGICTHSIENNPYFMSGYIAKPFMCNSLRKSDRNTLLISGSNITESDRIVEMDGCRWLDSGVMIMFMKNHCIMHNMPMTYDSIMP